MNGTPTAPGADGRLRFVVDLGPADTVQEYSAGHSTTFERRRVALAPHAAVLITKATRVDSGARVCARAIGGDVPRARMTAGNRGVTTTIRARTRCRVVRAAPDVAAVSVRGRDRFGHLVRATKRIRAR